MAAQIVANNFAVEQIENGRQVEFLVVQFELSNNGSKTYCEEVRQVVAALSEDISAFVPELLVLSVLVYKGFMT